MPRRKSLSVRRVIDMVRYDEKQHYFHVSAEMRNTPGSLAQMIISLADKGLNLVDGHFSTEEGVGFASVFATASVPGTRKEEIDSSLASIKSLKSFEVGESIDGLTIDSSSYPVSFPGGDRAVVFRKSLLNESFRRVRDILGTGGEVVLYEQGKAAGANDAKRLGAVIGKPRLLSRLEEVAGFYDSMGWGRSMLKIESVSPLSGQVTLEESFECEGASTGKPWSQFLRGHLEGFAEELFGVKTKCDEVECLSAGDSHCVFIVNSVAG